MDYSADVSLEEEMLDTPIILCSTPLKVLSSDSYSVNCYELDTYVDADFQDNPNLERVASMFDDSFDDELMKIHMDDLDSSIPAMADSDIDALGVFEDSAQDNPNRETVDVMFDDSFDDELMKIHLEDLGSFIPVMDGSDLDAQVVFDDPARDNPNRETVDAMFDDSFDDELMKIRLEDVVSFIPVMADSDIDAQLVFEDTARDNPNLETEDAMFDDSFDDELMKIRLEDWVVPLPAMAGVDTDGSNVCAEYVKVEAPEESVRSVNDVLPGAQAPTGSDEIGQHSTTFVPVRRSKRTKKFCSRYGFF